MSIVLHMKSHKLVQNSIDATNNIFGDEDLKQSWKHNKKYPYMVSACLLLSLAWHENGGIMVFFIYMLLYLPIFKTYHMQTGFVS